MEKKKKILFCDNTLWGLVNFRGAVIRHLVSKGFEIVLVAPQDETTFMKTVIPEGVRYIPVHMNRCSQNPFHDLKYFFTLYKIYRDEAPNYIFHYTIKPNIYGSFAASLLRIPNTDIITGLGHALVGDSIKNRIAAALYASGLRCANSVLVLNQFIADYVKERRICRSRKVILLKGGEGVCLDRFPMTDHASENTIFLMVGRLLKDKGYNEYVQAAREVLRRGWKARFQILGPLDCSYPKHITQEELDRDISDGIIEYLGVTDHVQQYLQQKGVVIVLPSYHEGLNRSLMEACSSGCPIITSDIPGCRETVTEGENGFLVPPRNVELLAEAMIRYLKLTPEEKNSFSLSSRKKAEKVFDMRLVIDEYLEILKSAGI